MPTARLARVRLAGTASGSEICSSAISRRASACIASMSAASFARNVSSRTAVARRVPGRRRRRAAPRRAAPRALLPRPRWRAAPRARAASRAASASLDRLAPLELPLEELDRQRGVAFVAQIDAVKRQQVLRARHRVFQRPVRLVDPRRRLQRDAAFRVARGSEAVGMHFALQRAIGGVEHRRVDAKRAGRPKSSK